MPSIVVIGHLTAANKEARQTVLDALTKVSQYSKQSEPGVLRYAITVPRDVSDEKSIYVIEEYADQAVLDSHMGSKAVTDLIAFFTANGDLFGGATNVSTLETSSAFVRPEITKCNDPFMCYASIDYKESSRADALEGWRHVTSETQNNESDTLSYAILKDKTNEITISTIEAYANEAFFREVHAKSTHVQENRAKYGEGHRTAFRFAFVKMVAGYLYKDKSGSNL
ncbi:uncharacterized protein BDR25DRAFT_339625 [Lindgomyces ingoldianus]|uniref:Uncharacterized protein n=1 Tax=Lindgomyces ingoldianus TaxID=673940 RepID=A0ACB6RBP7_9PLEO|nr:uncharacterized protein BDR25DRAFT_339625 [Lindgomyces ingoldianus]KAF2476713.1 hypothetical protein BDR25DRAFT_339625 [Lindgomyces ingoldianus]